MRFTPQFLVILADRDAHRIGAIYSFDFELLRLTVALQAGSYQVPSLLRCAPIEL